MAYLLVLGLIILSGVVLLLWVAKLALSPREIYSRGRTAFGEVLCCRHCDAVVTRDNIHEHGVNCSRRGTQPAKRRPF